MKSVKIILLAVLLTSGFALVNQALSSIDTSCVASMRVRTVPSSTDQKKKETTPEATPKTQIKSNPKEDGGFYCNDTGTIKAKLAVVNGGAPK
ncbi:MAG: hypothetical protein ABIO46_05320 [Chitinophagales bacterium]